MADDFLYPGPSRSATSFVGEILNGEASYFTPKTLKVRKKGSARGVTKDVLSWMFHYSGAFRNGDLVEVRGKAVTIGRRSFTFVDSDRTNYMRLLQSP
jgi:predicted nucleotidyltransferase